MGGCVSKGSVAPILQGDAGTQGAALYAAARNLTLQQAQAQAQAGSDSRRLCLICWDIENVRLPAAAPGLIPRDVVRHLKRAFITQEGRTEFKTVAALTQRSLARIEQDHPGFVDDVCGDMALLLASANHQKRNADVALKRELSLFTHEFAGRARGAAAAGGAPLIVLLTGDEDFLEPVQRALQQGFDVQLIHHDNAARPLVAQPYPRPPILWSHFLKTASGQPSLLLPGSDEHVTRLLLQLAGTRNAVTAQQQAPSTPNGTSIPQVNGSSGNSTGGPEPQAACFLLLTGFPQKWGVARVRATLQQACPAYTASPQQPPASAQQQAASGPSVQRPANTGAGWLHMMEPQKGSYPLIAIVALPPASSPVAIAAARMRIEAAIRGSPLGPALRVWSPWELIHVHLTVEVDGSTGSAGRSSRSSTAAAGANVSGGASTGAGPGSYRERAYEAQASAAHDLVDVCRTAGAQLLAQFAGCPFPSSATSSLMFLCPTLSNHHAMAGAAVGATPDRSNGHQNRRQGAHGSQQGVAGQSKLLPVISRQLPGLKARYGVASLTATALMSDISSVELAAAAAAAGNPPQPNTPARERGQPATGRQQQRQSSNNGQGHPAACRAPLFLEQRGSLQGQGGHAAGPSSSATDVSRGAPAAAGNGAGGPGARASVSPKRKRNKKKNRNKCRDQAEGGAHASGSTATQPGAGQDADAASEPLRLVSARSVWGAEPATLQVQNAGAEQGCHAPGCEQSEEGEGEIHTAHSNLSGFEEGGGMQGAAGTEGVGRNAVGMNAGYGTADGYL